jgi:hypothetical protein
MSVLTTADEVRERLGAAIRDRDHYVFIADSDRGKQILGRYAADLAAYFGVTDQAVMVSEFTFVATALARSSRVVILAVHKLAVPRWAVTTFIARGWPGKPLPPDADLFPMPDTGGDPAFLVAVIEAIRCGDASSFDPLQN